MKLFVKSLLHRLGYEIYRVDKGTASEESNQNSADRLMDELRVPRAEPVDRKEIESRIPPLTPSPVQLPSEGRLRAYRSVHDAVRNVSVEQYFQISQREDAIFAEENRIAREGRLRMIQAAVERFLGGWEGKTVLDVGCSTGFYSFYAARLGARALGIDARPEHEDQFWLFHTALGLGPEADYRHVDMENELETLREEFDLVLSMGVLYHVYDHPRFLRNMFRLTRKVLILDTSCSGRWDMLCKPEWEKVDYLRHSIHGPVLYPSARWTVELMRRIGFREIWNVPWPSDVEDGSGYGKLWRVMLVGLK